MFKGCKKIYKAILCTSEHYPEDISYRGEGLSNEYRLSLPFGLLGHNKATSFTRVFDAPKKGVQIKISPNPPFLVSFSSQMLHGPKCRALRDSLCCFSLDVIWLCLPTIFFSSCPPLLQHHDTQTSQDESQWQSAKSSHVPVIAQLQFVQTRGCPITMNIFVLALLPSRPSCGTWQALAHTFCAIADCEYLQQYSEQHSMCFQLVFSCS